MSIAIQLGMRKEEIINKPEALVVLNWKQRIESVSGLACIHLDDVLSMEQFTLKQLVDAQEEDRLYFKGLIEYIEILL